jgi:hypothetical protein
MRNALLLAIVGIATVSLFGCGDASSSTGIQRNRAPKAIPAEGDDVDHDPSDVDETTDPGNPNATTPPPPPATPGTVAGELGVTLSSAVPAADLGTTTEVTVTVEPKAGFTGAAALTVTGLPTGATGVFNPASVTLATAPVTSKLTITVPYTAVPSAAGTGTAIVVKAASGAIAATANANFKVNPKVTFNIPVNADALRAAGGVRYVDTWGGPSFGTAPAPLSTQAGNGIVFVVKNNDSVGHIVHGSNGFAHGSTATPIPPGGTDPLARTLNVGANASGYLHEGANTTSMSFRVTVAAAP